MRWKAKDEAHPTRGHASGGCARKLLKRAEKQCGGATPSGDYVPMAYWDTTGVTPGLQEPTIAFTPPPQPLSLVHVPPLHTSHTRTTHMQPFHANGLT